MDIAIIVAMTPQGVIGLNNQIPWYLPADLQRFKKITMGHPIVMGRKTFESLPGRLPGRQHIVLTRDKGYCATQCDIASSWEQVEELTAQAGKVFVIGGAALYEYALPIAQLLYMTIVHAELTGDTYFPKWNKNSWNEVDREFLASDEKNKFDLEFVQYTRRLSNI